MRTTSRLYGNKGNPALRRAPGPRLTMFDPQTKSKEMRNVPSTSALDQPGNGSSGSHSRLGHSVSQVR